MSRSIWMRCEGSSKLRALDAEVWRVVESQHIVSTRKLVDSDAEQALLEELIEKVKPPMPPGPAFANLHYLLMTPFRHPPLRYGSRFGTSSERGIFYGSLELSTCFAEVSYYRLLFLAGTTADLSPVTVELTAFAARAKTKRGVDLSRTPFRAFERDLTSKTSYRATHALGRDMRAAGVTMFYFVSARAPGRKKNVGVFEPCFTGGGPKKLETWICTADVTKVELTKKTFGVGLGAQRETRGETPRTLRFERAHFEVAGALVTPSD